MKSSRRYALACVLVCALLGAGCVEPAASQSKPEGEMRWALYVTLSPLWFDPGEVVGVITPFWVLYALHDALVKPMPGNLMAPSLAESWTVSADLRVYEFKLREGVKFHNGDPFTAEDVRFSFQRSKGAKLLREKVREVVAVGPHRVRFQLHEPWPDFMTFYGTLATAAGWIVPKKYVEQVGDDGFKKQPVGLGPYRFVSHTPGVELVMEAFEDYWRKVPHVKRLVYKSVPEATTRLAMLKKGEVEFALPLEPDPYDPVKAKQLLAEAGYPNGFDAGDLHAYPPYNSTTEAVGGYLGAVGIRTKVRTMERAAFFSAWATKKLRGVCMCVLALYGNAASRMAEWVPSSGVYAYGGYPDVDALYKQQALETDRRKREALLHKIQQLLHERARFAPIWDYTWPSAK